MAKRVIQHATSASRQTRRVKKPSRPWTRGLPVDVPQAVIDANPDHCLKRIYTGKDRRRIDQMLNNGYVFPKIPKGVATSVNGQIEGKDTVVMALPKERKEARDYYVQQRAEQHLQESENKQKAEAGAAGFPLMESTIDTGE